MPAGAERSSLPWLAQPLFRWSAGIVLAVTLGVVAFEMLDISIFKRIGMAHEFCYLREPKLIWLHVISDVLIGLAYVSISATLGYLVYKASKGIPFNWVFLAFGLFIVSCGLTHFMEVWVIWEPVYWMSGYVKVVTAAASVATAVALFPLLPKVFRLVESARQSEQRRREIEQLNQELERFNYSVAHDLRSPLRGISGFSQLLQEEIDGKVSPEAREYLARINASVAKMDALISDLLKYASVGRQAIQLEPVPLAEVFRNVNVMLGGEIHQRGAEVVIPSTLPVVYGDATLLQVAFQNLIGNGIKFSRRDVAPRVEISAEQQGDLIVVHVVDNGSGIPETARTRVFQMFERFHLDREGTGIGLPIVHRAIERMNGEITVHGGPDGVGTRFSVKLPVAAEAWPRQPARAAASGLVAL